MEEVDNQLIKERFHGLPTARFRLSDGVPSPFKVDAEDEY